VVPSTVRRALKSQIHYTKSSLALLSLQLHAAIRFLSHMHRSAGIFFWFLRKRDKNPLKYGPSRYGLDNDYAAGDLAGGHGPQGKVPASVDA
jgi:hypothetical protein